MELFENIYPDYQITDLNTNSLGVVGVAYYKSGDLSKSSLFLNELLSKSRKSPAGSPSFYAAAIYTAMGENGKAIHSLEKAFDDHEVEMYWLKVEPFFQALHGDPRFENLLKKIGFS
jgi:tetratricopeptide (TPR) repeat protein